MDLVTAAIFAGACVPLAVAWHLFVSRFLVATLAAAANALILVTFLLSPLGLSPGGHHLLPLLLAAGAIALAVSLLVGLVGRQWRRSS